MLKPTQSLYLLLKSRKMKKGIIIIMLGLLALSLAGESNCEVYIPIEVGTKITYQNFNHKDKLEGTQKMEIKNVEKGENKLSITAHMELLDDKGEMTYDDDFKYYCENGIFHIDMENMLPAETMEAYKDMEVSVEQSELTIPASIEPGMTLDDAKLTMKVSTNGIAIMSMDVNITDRKIEAKETITTEAGSFECYKLTYNTSSKMGFVNVSTSSIEWFSPNVGMVRSETYDKKGKLESYSVLTSLTK